MKKFLIIFSVMFMLFLLLCKYAISENLVVREYPIENSKISENARLLLITDLHSCIYGENQSTLINKINEINPDAILFGGDILDDKRSDEGSKLLFESIGGKYKCYYVTGNHEYWSYRSELMKRMIRSYGITVLNGEGENINDCIRVYGINDPYCEMSKYGAYSNWTEELNNVKNDVDSNKFNILLTHRPERVGVYKNTDFDLILSGHAHGGQWRLPYLINGLYAPGQGCFPKYAGGYYNLGKNSMIVSRGLALSNCPRIFNPPELVVININQKK